MGITVLSPYDGSPVKVRDQDAGRAVRDREKRIFYVLEKSDGSGYYGAMTRAGGEKDEQRAAEFEAKLDTLKANRTSSLQPDSTAGDPPEIVTTVHDATGRKRRGRKRKTVVAALLLIILAAAGYYLAQPYLENRHELEPVGEPTPSPNVEPQSPPLPSPPTSPPTSPPDSPPVSPPATPSIPPQPPTGQN